MKDPMKKSPVIKYTAGQIAYELVKGDCWAKAKFAKRIILDIAHSGNEIVYKCASDIDGCYTYVYEKYLYSSPEEFKRNRITHMQELANGCMDMHPFDEFILVCDGKPLSKPTPGKNHFYRIV